MNSKEDYFYTISNENPRVISDKELHQREDVLRSIFFDIKRANHLTYNAFSVVDKNFPPGVAFLNNGFRFDYMYTERFTKPELAFVYGHEIGHQLSYHILIMNYIDMIHKKICNQISDVIGGQLDKDVIFLNAVAMKQEFEADLLGASLATKAGYHSEISALEKIGNGLLDLPYIFDEHPYTPDRIQYLLEHPLFEYKSDIAMKEYVFLSNLCSRISDKISPEDFVFMCDVENKYISEAHNNLLGRQQFLEERKFLIEEAISVLSYSENEKLKDAFHRSLDGYVTALRSNKKITEVPLLKTDAESLIQTMLDFRKLVDSKKKQHSIIGSLKKVFSRKEGEQYEL